MLKKYIRSGKITQILSSFRLLELAGKFSTVPLPHTFYNGKGQIESICTSPKLSTKTFSFILFYFGVKDHQIIVVDFLIDQFFSKLFLPLYRL